MIQPIIEVKVINSFKHEFKGDFQFSHLLELYSREIRFMKKLRNL